MKFKSLLLVVNFLFIAQLSAVIVESNKIEHVLDYLDKETLMIFDIDNTIAEPDNETGWGSDQWLYAHIERMVEKGVSPSVAWSIALPMYFEVQRSKNFWLKPVEDCSVAVVKKSQEKADKVIVLTARSYPLIPTTLRLMKGIGVNFLENGFDEEFIFDRVPGKYTHGIFFCGDGDKGESLIELFMRLNYWPKKVVFTDDKYKNLHSVEKAVEAHGIEFVGIHYTYLGDKVKNFRLVVDVP